MYTLIRSYYLSGRWNDTQLDAAVTKGYITAEQADQIRAAKAAQDAEQEIIDGLVLGALDE